MADQDDHAASGSQEGLGSDLASASAVVSDQGSSQSISESSSVADVVSKMTVAALRQMRLRSAKTPMEPETTTASERGQQATSNASSQDVAGDERSRSATPTAPNVTESLTNVESGVS